MLSRLLRKSLHRRGNVAELQRQRKVDGAVSLKADLWHVQADGRISMPVASLTIAIEKKW
jgi:hypothetical protein